MTIKLSLEALEVIDAIARKGSFAAAAESLFKVPSALTYTVRKLEEDLGVSLFNRSGHRATLTEAGAELLNEGRNLLNAASELGLAGFFIVARAFGANRAIALSNGNITVKLHLCLAFTDFFISMGAKRRTFRLKA